MLAERQKHVKYMQQDDDTFSKIQARIEQFKKDGFTEDEAVESAWVECIPLVRRIIAANIDLCEEEEEEEDDDDDGDDQIDQTSKINGVDIHDKTEKQLAMAGRKTK